MHLSDTLLGVTISGGVGLIGAVITAGVSHRVSKRAAQTENKKAEAAIQSAINDGFGQYLAAWQAERAELHQTIEDLKSYISGLKTYIGQLIEVLRDRNLPVPEPKHGPLTVITGGKDAKADHG